MVDIRLAEDDEQVALAGVLQIIGHVQVGVHARLEHRDGAQLAELGRTGIVVEGAGHQHIEPGIARLARRGHQVRTPHRAELRPDEDTRPPFAALFFAALEVAPFGADVIPWPGGEREEIDLVFLMGLLHPGGLEIFEDHLLEALPGGIPGLAFGHLVDQFIIFIHAQDAVRREALDRERPGHAHFLVVFVGFVVQVFVLGFGSDGCVDLFLAGDAQLPPFFMQALGFCRTNSFLLRVEFPILPMLFSTTLLSCSRRGSIFP